MFGANEKQINILADEKEEIVLKLDENLRNKG